MNEKLKKIKEFVISNKYLLLVIFIFLIGFLTRIIGIGQVPDGLNRDEASAGYEAWALMTNGIDRNGKTFPVHFISWGSGQNVLYSYILIPFIKIFGLNSFAIRLPMAIIGCISLIVMYKLLKRFNNSKLTIIGLTFFAINPWHIMKSRWGLESNIFPDIFFWAIYMLITGIKDKKISRLYLSMVIMGISTYAYGTAYLFLPLFLVCISIYLLKNKYINVKNIIISSIILLVITFPLILFVLINMFDLNEIKLFNTITIPRTFENRFEEETLLSSNDSALYSRIISFIYVFILQYDKGIYNAIPIIGTIYIISLPFTIFGIYKCIKLKNVEIKILNYWSLSALSLCIMFDVININRINIIMIPLIVYTLIGIYYLIKYSKLIKNIVVVSYVLFFSLFLVYYPKFQNTSNISFIKNIDKTLEVVDDLNVEKVYLSDFFNQMYIYVLFYEKYDVKDYINSAEYKKQHVAFEYINSFGKYNFYLPEELNDYNAVYIVDKNYEFDKELYDCETIGEFNILKLK